MMVTATASGATPASDGYGDVKRTAAVAEQRFTVASLGVHTSTGDPCPVARLARRVSGERERVQGGVGGVVHDC